MALTYQPQLVVSRISSSRKSLSSPPSSMPSIRFVARFPGLGLIHPMEFCVWHLDRFLHHQPSIQVASIWRKNPKHLDPFWRNDFLIWASDSGYLSNIGVGVSIFEWFGGSPNLDKWILIHNQRYLSGRQRHQNGKKKYIPRNLT